MAVIAALAISLMMVGGASAQSSSWIDELNNSLSFYKTAYPASNWDPYEKKITTVRDALGRGDQGAVRTEMGQFFKMLRARAHGISDVAADELFNFAVMVTPVQEYQIAVPGGMPGQ
jgi:hypothetical protein